ncbi:MAG: LysR family transcriptional regulator [Actinomycetota bacterium]
MQLDIESLRTLLAVLDHGGMTRAAERLHMTQSAVSRKVQRLEERVGRPLLIRDGHDLRLTRDGRALLADARALVEIHDNAVARLESSDLTGTVKLSSNGEVNLCEIASLLGTFKLRHPMAHVEFALDHTGSIVDQVDHGGIDIAIIQVTEDRVRPTDIVLWSEDLVWVTAAGEQRREAPLPTIDFGEHCYYNGFTHKILHDAGIDFTTVFSAAASIDVRAAVDAGIGVAVMSSRYLGENVVEWRPPVDLAPLPEVVQVLRTVPGEQPDAVAALVETIQTELTRGRVPG